jgi:hypothetical protein
MTGCILRKGRVSRQTPHGGRRFHCDRLYVLAATTASRRHREMETGQITWNGLVSLRTIAEPRHPRDQYYCSAIHIYMSCTVVLAQVHRSSNAARPYHMATSSWSALWQLRHVDSDRLPISRYIDHCKLPAESIVAVAKTGTEPKTAQEI